MRSLVREVGAGAGAGKIPGATVPTRAGAR